jgi:baseplate J-like protein
MADLTPIGIFAPASSDEILQKLINYLKAIPANPIDDWNEGGVMRTIVELERVTDVDLIGSAIPEMVSAAAVDYANSAWLTIAAQQLYSVNRTDGVVAIQTLTLTCDGSHGPYTITAGQLWFAGTTGNRWVNATGGTLNTGATLAIQIAAEGPGAKYNDPAGTVKTMLIPLSGVTAVNTATDFSPVTTAANSTGTLTPSRTSVGVTPTAVTFIVRIDSSGQVGAGAWSYSVDGGRSFRSGGVIATTDLLLDATTLSGTRVTFANGAATPSFVAGDQFAFTTPGTSFVTVGKDQESDVSLIARCKGRWPDLTARPTQSRYLKWAKAASTEVTRVRLEEDATYLGKLYVTLAGVVGPVSGGAVTAVQAYINPRAQIGRIVVARAASALEITGSGTVLVAAARLGEVQAAAQTAWQAVLLASDIGQVVRVSDLVRAVMDAGAVDITGPQLNGGGNVALASTKVAILNATTPLLANQLTWQTI